MYSHDIARACTCELCTHNSTNWWMNLTYCVDHRYILFSPSGLSGPLVLIHRVSHFWCAFVLEVPCRVFYRQWPSSVLSKASHVPLVVLLNCGSLSFCFLVIQACYAYKRAPCMILSSFSRWRTSQASFRCGQFLIFSSPLFFSRRCDVLLRRHVLLWLTQRRFLGLLFLAPKRLKVFLQFPGSILRTCGSRPGNHCNVADIAVTRQPIQNNALGLQAKSGRWQKRNSPWGQSVWGKSRNRCFSQLGDVIGRPTGHSAPTL